MQVFKSSILQQKMNTKIFCWICVFMMVCYHVQGQEYHCVVEFTGKCINKITWKIPEKYAQRKTPFTVSYMLSEGQTENAVLLHYVGRYYCEAAAGHVCDDGGNSTSIIGDSTTTCVTNRTYILAADGEDDVLCIRTQNEADSTGSHPDNHKQNDTCCRNGNFYKNQSFIGAIAGIVCAVIIIILLIVHAVVWFQTRRRWRFIKEDNAPPADPEDKEATKGLIIPTT